MENDTCAECDASFCRANMQQRYCSSRCRASAAAKRRGGWYRKMRPAEGPLRRECATCGEPFATASGARRYCSDRCKWRAKARRQHGHQPRIDRGGRCSVTDCPKAHLARGYCPGHYKAWRRSQGFVDASEGAGRKSSKRHIARAKRYGVPWERFKPVEVFERDGWICGLCGDPVDPDLEHPDPLSVSLDHITPLVQGGGHLRDNCQCSHLTCNLRKERGPRQAAAVLVA